MDTLSVRHDFGREVTVNVGGKDRFTLDYVSAPKPFIHPVRTTSGYEMTLFQPSDHYWHRGLWFAIKFVNGENFWEEKDGEPINRQIASAPASILPIEAGGVRIELPLDWVTHKGETVLRERRHITYRPWRAGAYLIDHQSEIVAVAKGGVLLDRTPFTTWGGYGGLCFRGSRNWTGTKIVLSDGTETDRPKGFPARWAVLTGKLDGDKELTGAVGILDHPRSLRHPVPWYGGNGPNHYLTPAPLFHEPYRAAENETLHFDYRLVISERELPPTEMEELAKSW